MFTNLLKNLELLEFLGHEKRPTPTDDGVNGRFQMEAMQCTTFEDAALIPFKKRFPITNSHSVPRRKENGKRRKKWKRKSSKMVSKEIITRKI